jgi:hypothetical protein
MIAHACQFMYPIDRDRINDADGIQKRCRYLSRFWKVAVVLSASEALDRYDVPIPSVTLNIDAAIVLA